MGRNIFQDINILKSIIHIYMSSKIVKTLRPYQKTPLKPLILLGFSVLKALKTSLRLLRLLQNCYKKECIHHVRTLKCSIQFPLYQGFLVCSQHTPAHPHTHITCLPLPCTGHSIDVVRSYSDMHHPCKDMTVQHICNIHLRKLSFNHAPYMVLVMVAMR